MVVKDKNAKMGGAFCWRKAMLQEDWLGMDCYIYTNFEDVVVKTFLHETAAELAEKVLSGYNC